MSAFATDPVMGNFDNDTNFCNGTKFFDNGTNCVTLETILATLRASSGGGGGVPDSSLEYYYVQ